MLKPLYIDLLGSGVRFEASPLLQLDDLIGIGLCILALFITYFWQKKSKNQETKERTDNIQQVRPIPVRATEYDIFGLPKKNQGRRNTQQDIPFTKFSLKQAYWFLAILIAISLLISLFRQHS